MERWEYLEFTVHPYEQQDHRVISIKGEATAHHFGGTPPLSEYLKKIGQDGWEIITIIPGNIWTFFAKRPLGGAWPDLEKPVFDWGDEE